MQNVLSTIPKVDEEITPTYLNKHLDNFNIIKEVNITKPSTEGGMSYVRIVSLKYEFPLDEKKISSESIVIKYLGNTVAVWFDMALGGHYEREILWY